MADVLDASFPVPNPPPPPLKGKVELADSPTSREPDSMPNLPPSLALPSDDELKAEQSRQNLLNQLPTPADRRQNGGIVSVAQVPITPPAPPPPPAPAPVPAPTPTPAPAPAPAPGALPGTASDMRPPEPPAYPTVNPLAQRIVRPSPPTMAEQLLPPPAAPVMANGPVTGGPVAGTSPVALPPLNQTPAAAPPVDLNANMLAGLDDETAPRRRRPWLVLGIIAGLLVVAGGIGFWLQSSGTIYSSLLQKVAGGFPKEPAQALALLKTKQASRYGLTGQISLVKSSQLPTVGGETGTTTTAEFSGSVQAKKKDTDWEANFNIQLASDYPVTTLQGDGLKVGDKTYIYLDTLSLLISDNQWSEISPDEWDKTALTTPFAAIDLDGLLSRSSEGQFLGQNSLTVGGTSYNVNVYQYKVEAAGDYQDADYQEGRLLIWVNRRNGQIVEYQLDERLKNDGLGDIVFQSVWEVNLAEEVAAIALAEGVTPKSGTARDLAMGLGFITAAPVVVDTATPAGRDQKRTSDLLALKEALIAYQKQRGTYPVAQEVDKTNDSRILKNALVPEFLDALPVDPQDPKVYYGYTSDGFSFKLTSIVEDSSNPSAKQGNGFFYQEVRN